MSISLVSNQKIAETSSKGNQEKWYDAVTVCSGDPGGVSLLPWDSIWLKNAGDHHRLGYSVHFAMAEGKVRSQNCFSYCIHSNA